MYLLYIPRIPAFINVNVSQASNLLYMGLDFTVQYNTLVSTVNRQEPPLTNSYSLSLIPTWSVCLKKGKKLKKV